MSYVALAASAPATSYSVFDAVFSFVGFIQLSTVLPALRRLLHFIFGYLFIPQLEASPFVFLLDAPPAPWYSDRAAKTNFYLAIFIALGLALAIGFTLVYWHYRLRTHRSPALNNSVSSDLLESIYHSINSSLNDFTNINGPLNARVFPHAPSFSNFANDQAFFIAGLGKNATSLALTPAPSIDFASLSFDAVDGLLSPPSNAVTTFTRARDEKSELGDLIKKLHQRTADFLKRMDENKRARDAKKTSATSTLNNRANRPDDESQPSSSIDWVAIARRQHATSQSSLTPEVPQVISHDWQRKPRITWEQAMNAPLRLDEIQDNIRRLDEAAKDLPDLPPVPSPEVSFYDSDY